jgi:predicted HTH transcriptional regulator
VEEKLNDRQKKIIQQVLKEGFVTSGWCLNKLKISYDTANRDFAVLIDLNILKKTGNGPGTRYIMVKEI